jgi:hypothetical protein
MQVQSHNELGNKIILMLLMKVLVMKWVKSKDNWSIDVCPESP